MPRETLCCLQNIWVPRIHFVFSHKSNTLPWEALCSQNIRSLSKNIVLPRETLFTRKKHFCSLKKVLSYPKQTTFTCKTFAFPMKMCLLSKKYSPKKLCVHSQNICDPFQKFVLPQETLRSFANHLHAFAKILHSPNKLCDFLQNYCDLPSNLVFAYKSTEISFSSHLILFPSQKFSLGQSFLGQHNTFVRECKSTDIYIFLFFYHSSLCRLLSATAGGWVYEIAGRYWTDRL